MFGKLFGGDHHDETLPSDWESRIRDRMHVQGITEEEATRLVLAEEEPAVGTRQVQTGEVEVSKRVVMEHVREPVTLRREEVKVERRPIADGRAAPGTTLGGGEEIRIPLRAEEVVVHKRIVPMEELVVRKREVEVSEVVEADLRRERAEVHREAGTRETDRRYGDPRG